MSLITPGKVPAFGYRAIKMARNGVAVHAGSLAGAASLLNTISAKRRKIHFNIQGKPEEIPTSATAANIWRFRGRTSANVKEVRCRMIFAPTDSALTYPGVAQWTVDINSGGGVAQTAIYPSLEGSAIAVPNNWRVVEQVWVDGSGDNISTDKVIDCSLSVDEGARPIGCTVYEVQHATLDTTANYPVVDPSVFIDGADIFDRDITDLISGAYTLWKQSAPALISYSRIDGTYQTQNSTTYKNILSGTTTAYAATDAGWRILTTGLGTYNSNNIPVVLWCWAKTSAGTGNVRFIGSGGTLGTITGISTTEGFFTASVNLSSATGADLVTISCNNDAADTTSVLAAGMYQYSA